MSGKIQPLRPIPQKAGVLDLSPVVAGLRHSRDVAHNIRLGGKVTDVPSASVISEVTNDIVTSLFPTHLGPHGLTPGNVDQFVSNTLSTSFIRLTDQIARGLQFDARRINNSAARQRANDIIEHFAQQLPLIRALLVSDLKAAQRHDASAESLAEVLICHPGSRAIIHHRIAHALHGLGARFVARIISALAHATTGITIHPGARIGAGFFINHGMGVVIGETAVIGENVCLHHGVTLGESDIGPDFLEDRRIHHHPIVEDNVIIHAGATLVGRITVGAGSIIGGHVCLTRSVPPGTTVSQAAHSIADIHHLA